MPTEHPCPQCGEPVRLQEDMLGKRVRCPRCEGVFVAPPPAPGRAEAGAASMPRPASERIRRIRRRRRWAFLKPLAFTLAAAILLAAVGKVVWRKLEKDKVFERMGRSGAGQGKGAEAVGTGRGFHILPDDFWSVFDDETRVSRLAVNPPKPKASAEATEIDAEGLEVRVMEDTGPYYIAGQMGGLVPSAVGVWVSPNRLGQGPEAFYAEPGEEVKATHWARNYGGFKVYRIPNAKKRPGPGGKTHEAGWILGMYLRTKDGERIR